MPEEKNCGEKRCVLLCGEMKESNSFGVLRQAVQEVPVDLLEKCYRVNFCYSNVAFILHIRKQTKNRIWHQPPISTVLVTDLFFFLIFYLDCFSNAKQKANSSL